MGPGRNTGDRAPQRRSKFGGRGATSAAFVSTQRLYFHFPTSCPPTTHATKLAAAAVATACPRDRAGAPRPPERGGRAAAGGGSGSAPSSPRAAAARALPVVPRAPRPRSPPRRRETPTARPPLTQAARGAPSRSRPPKRSSCPPPAAHAGHSRTAGQPLRPPRRSRTRRRQPSRARRAPAAARIARRRAQRLARPPSAPARGGSGSGGAGRLAATRQARAWACWSPRPSPPVAPRLPPLSNPPAAQGPLPDAVAAARHFRDGGGGPVTRGAPRAATAAGPAPGVWGAGARRRRPLQSSRALPVRCGCFSFPGAPGLGCPGPRQPFLGPGEEDSRPAACGGQGGRVFAAEPKCEAVPPHAIGPA